MDDRKLKEMGIIRKIGGININRGKLLIRRKQSGDGNIFVNIVEI